MQKLLAWNVKTYIDKTPDYLSNPCLQQTRSADCTGTDSKSGAIFSMQGVPSLSSACIFQHEASFILALATVFADLLTVSGLAILVVRPAMRASS